MPVCPGCKSQLSHSDCIEHLRYCKWVWSNHPERESRWGEQLLEQLRE